MTDKVEEYRRLSIENESTDYGNKKSVQKRNQNVKKMYSLVENISVDEESIFLNLLDEPIPAKWLAHQLIEKRAISKKIKAKCAVIIKKLVKGDDMNALGEKMWLNQWKIK